jgi:hypothetical protein
MTSDCLINSQSLVIVYLIYNAPKSYFRLSKLVLFKSESLIYFLKIIQPSEKWLTSFFVSYQMALEFVRNYSRFFREF